MGIDLFETTEPPCPALIYEDDKFWCGVVKHGDTLVPKSSTFLKLILGIGVGCDSIYGL